MTTMERVVADFEDGTTVDSDVTGEGMSTESRIVAEYEKERDESEIVAGRRGRRKRTNLEESEPNFERVNRGVAAARFDSSEMSRTR